MSEGLTDFKQGKGDNPLLNSENEELEVPLEAAEKSGDDHTEELALLKEKLASIEAERHQERVDSVLKARFKVGLVKDREAEAIRLKDLDDTTLILLEEDAERFAEMLSKTTPTGPKAKYTLDEKSAFEAAVEDTRMRLFGHRKEVEA